MNKKEKVLVSIIVTLMLALVAYYWSVQYQLTSTSQRDKQITGWYKDLQTKTQVTLRTYNNTIDELINRVITLNETLHSLGR